MRSWNCGLLRLTDGIDSRAILDDTVGNPRQLRFTRPALAAPRIATLIRAYRQTDVMALLRAAFGDMIRPGWS